MLAWHTTGANSMRNNEVRTLVLQRVHNAIPPLPHNSTRGLTPGLINPLLGNIPGNSVPHPPGRNNQGRLRVGVGRPRATQPAAVVANQAQGNLAQGNPVQNNRGRSNRERGHRTPSKRNRTSPDHTGRPTKRHAQDINFDTEDDSNIDTRSDKDKSSEVWIDAPDIPRTLLTGLRTNPYRSLRPVLEQHEPESPASLCLIWDK